MNAPKMNVQKTNAWWEKVLAVSPELDAAAREKSRLLAGLLATVIVTVGLAILIRLLTAETISARSIYAASIMPVWGALYLLNRYGYFRAASIGTVALAVILTLGTALLLSNDDVISFVYTFAPVIIALILFELRRALFFTGGLLLTVLIALFAFPSPLDIGDRINILTTITVFSAMVIVFIVYIRRVEGARLVEQAVLEASNKELEQFAYVAAHDLKSPLRGISHLAQWLEEELNTAVTPEQQRYFQLLHGRVQRMEALVEGLRLYYAPTRTTARPLDKINVRALAQEVAAKVNPPPHLQIQIEVMAGAAELTTNRNQLEQVLYQLVDNAVRHHDKEFGGIIISARERENVYQFSVSDDGPGIDPRYHEKAFAIFQTLQARDQLESVGIGLPLVKKLVEANGGAIWLESAVGQGSTFFFTWPK